GSSWKPGAAIRDGDWKLIEFYHHEKFELYNLADDIGEQNDLAKERPQLVKKLHGMLQSWRKETGAIVPKAPNPRFDQKAEAKAIHAARLKLRPIK
ncbi:MAG: aryl-sulfate sulfohydrolase, partial [Limisphaerales bacterium]